MNDLQVDDLDYRVEILGVNWNLDDESANRLMTERANLPWLQDTSQAEAKTLFGAVYRDVIILDGLNREISPRFNLTAYDLSSAINQGVLKELLRGAAELVDTDADGLADDWEERFLGGLEFQADSDSDGDGENVFIEYSLGSDPSDRMSAPQIKTGTILHFEEKKFMVSFRRRIRGGRGLKYTLDFSANGQIWEDAEWSLLSDQVNNPYDGTGTETVTFLTPNMMGKRELYRIRVVKP